MENQLHGKCIIHILVLYKKFWVKQIKFNKKWAKFVGVGDLVLFPFSCVGAKMKWVYSGGARPISLPEAFSPFLLSLFKINLICKWTFLSENAKVKRVYSGARPIPLPRAFPPFCFHSLKLIWFVSIVIGWRLVSSFPFLNKTKACKFIWAKTCLKPDKLKRVWKLIFGIFTIFTNFIHLHLDASMK